MIKIATTNNNYKVLIKAVVDESKIQEQLDKISKNFKGINFTSSINGAKGMTSGFNSMASAGAKANQTFGDIIGKVGKFNAATAVINNFKQAIEMGVESVFKLDNSLTEFRKVSDLAGDALSDYTAKASEMGLEVGRAGSEMIDAATEFRKNSFNDTDSLILAKTATMFQNVADEAVSAGDSASFIISQMKAFNIEASKSQHIIDAVNEVANNFAVSSGDLSGSIPKVASTMAQANNSFEETLGLITAGTEIMVGQSDRVARGLRSITLNLQGMTDEGEESQELIAKMEEDFNKLGITLMGSGGQLKSTYDILSELAGKWDELDSNTRNYYAALIGGKTQVDVVNSVLSNFDSAIGATEAAMNSAGSAVKENEKYMDSLSGKMAQLNSAFEVLANKVIGSGFVGAIIDAGTVLLNFISGIVDGVNGLIDVFKRFDPDFRLDESISDLKEIDDNIVEINAQLEKNHARIKEIQDLGTLSIADQNELFILQQENEELAKRLELEQNIRLAKSGDVTRNAEKALDKDYDVVTGYESNIGLGVGQYNEVTEENLKLTDAVNATSEAMIRLKQEMAAVDQSTAEGKAHWEELNDMLGEVYQNSADEADALLNIRDSLDATIPTQAELIDEIDNYINTLSDAANYAGSMKDVQDTLNDSVNQFIPQLQNSKAELDLLTWALDSYNSTGEWSSEVVRALVNQFPNLLNGYATEEGQLLVTNQAFADMVNTEIRGSTESAQAVINSTRAKIKALVALANAATVSAAAGGTLGMTGMNTNSEAVARMILDLDNAAKEAEASLSSLNSISSVAGGTFYKTGGGASSAAGSTNKYSSAANKATDATRELEKAQREQEKAQREQQKALEEAQKAYMDSLKNEADILEKAQNGVIAIIDKEIEALKKKNEEQEKDIELQKAQEALARARESKVQIYREGKGWVYESDFSAISEAQEELDKINNEKIINDQIDQLEKLKDAWENALDIHDQEVDYQLMLERIGNVEKMSYEERLKALQKFTEEYKKLQEQINPKPESTLKPNPTPTPSPAPAPSPALNVGNKVTVKKSATHFSPSSGGVKMKSFVPGGQYDVMEVSGNEVLIGRGGVWTGWVYKHDLEGYAKGISSLPENQLSIVGEKPYSELAVPPNKNGTLASLRKGTGIVPANLTENLMEIGKYSPAQLMYGLGNNLQGTAEKNNIINISNITLPNVNDAESFVKELENFPTLATRDQN